jgi:hypothetical protein
LRQLKKILDRPNRATKRNFCAVVYTGGRKNMKKMLAALAVVVAVTGSAQAHFPATPHNYTPRQDIHKDIHKAGCVAYQVCSECPTYDSNGRITGTHSCGCHMECLPGIH